MLRILYIGNEGTLGGAMLSLIDYLQVAKDILVPIVVVPAAGSASETIKSIGVSCHIVPFERDYGKKDSTYEEKKNTVFINNYIAGREIAEIAVRENVDIIHTNSSVSNVGAIASVIANIPHVWHVRELLEEHYDSAFYDERLKCELLRCASKIITISEYAKRCFFQKYSIDSRMIYNGISFSNDVYDAPLNSRGTFLNLGVISTNKGQWDAVRAVHLLKNKGINTKLYIVGNGNGKVVWCIKQYIKKHALETYIEIIPFTRDLAKVRKECAFSIICSRGEALGRVTVEAMAANSIPIGADSGGTSELIGEDGERGFLYAWGNYNQLAEKMQYVLSLPEKDKDVIKTRMRRFAWDTFDVNRYARTMYDLYNDVIKTDNSDKRQKMNAILRMHYNEIESGYKTISKDERKLSNKEIVGRLGDIIMWLKERKADSIIIYGMGVVGCELYERIKKTDIIIEGVMDQDASMLREVTTVIDKENRNVHADCIIVTVLQEAQAIIYNLKKSFNCDVISVNDILSMEHKR